MWLCYGAVGELAGQEFRWTNFKYFYQGWKLRTFIECGRDCTLFATPSHLFNQKVADGQYVHLGSQKAFDCFFWTADDGFVFIE